MNQRYIYIVMFNDIPVIWQFERDEIINAMFYCNSFQEADEFAKRLNLDGYIVAADFDVIREEALKHSCTVFQGKVVNGFLEFQQEVILDEL